MGNLLANSIAGSPGLAAFDSMMEQRFDDIDMSSVLMNLIDTTSPTALPYLASQFDVLGYKGWRFVSTDTDKRELIKRGVELDRYKGTPWSIKEALKLIGITDSSILEGVYVLLYNAEQYYDGTWSYGNSNWATFSVLIDAASFPVLTSALAQDMISLILEYKNERSHLISVGFTDNETDNLPPDEADDFGLNFPGEDVGQGNYYDGTSNYNGAYLYEVLLDSLTITITQGAIVTTVTI